MPVRSVTNNASVPMKVKNSSAAHRTRIRKQRGQCSLFKTILSVVAFVGLIGRFYIVANRHRHDEEVDVWTPPHAVPASGVANPAQFVFPPSKDLVDERNYQKIAETYATTNFVLIQATTEKLLTIALHGTASVLGGVHVTEPMREEAKRHMPALTETLRIHFIEKFIGVLRATGITSQELQRIVTDPTGQRLLTVGHLTMREHLDKQIAPILQGYLMDVGSMVIHSEDFIGKMYEIIRIDEETVAGFMTELEAR